MVYSKHQRSQELGTESAQFELGVASWGNCVSEGRDNKCRGSRVDCLVV